MGEAIAGRTNETAGNPLLDLVRSGVNPDHGDKAIAPEQHADKDPKEPINLGLLSGVEDLMIFRNPDDLPRREPGTEQPASKIPDETFYGDVPIPSKGLGRVEDGDKLATNPLAVEKLSSKQTLENAAQRLIYAYKAIMPRISLHKWDGMGTLLEEYLAAEEEFCIQMRCRVNDEVLPENRVNRETFIMILMEAASANPYDEWSTETVRWFNAQMEPDECEGILKVYFRGWVMVEKLGEILTVATKEVILCNIFNHGCPETVESHGVPTTMMSNLELF